MGSIDTRLHELEARVAALERPHIHHARELQFGTDEPSYLEQAARPAPQQPRDETCRWCLHYDFDNHLCHLDLWSRKPGESCGRWEGQPRGGGG